METTQKKQLLGAGELRSKMKEDFRCKESSENNRIREWGSDVHEAKQGHQCVFTTVAVVSYVSWQAGAQKV